LKVRLWSRPPLRRRQPNLPLLHPQPVPPKFRPSNRFLNALSLPVAG